MKKKMTMTKEKLSLCCWSVWSAFSRKKTLDVRSMQETQLQRCLGVIDLTALGIGSTLGAGIYLLIGNVAKNLSGPAVVVSFLIAAFASFLAGICFAEFSARVPKAGSAYIYSYVSVGEFWAFVIGWNMILENIIGAAASGKAWSQFMDSIFNDTIRRYLEEEVGLMDGTGWFDSYPDFLALGFLLVATGLSCVGVKISSRINVVFTVVNLAVIVCIIGVGFFYANIENWSQAHGGFFPFGFRGVMAGAATCFYSFVGFDAITTSGEESTNPTRHVPLAIVITLIICLVGYLCVSSILTLLVPWNTLASTAALPKAFAQRGIFGAEYVIAVGGVCGLSAATLAAMYPLPRNIYAMAQDGLLYQWIGHVWKRTETPVVAACVSGVLVALSALLLDLDSLIEMMSIGTLMAYTMVAISILILHYQKESVGLTASNSVPGPTWGKEDHQRIASSSSNQPNHHQQHSMTPNSCFSTSNRLGRLPSNSDSTRMSMTEDTGLLKVGGEGNNKVRYVPTKTTTVVKKIKPRDEADDSEVEDNAFADPPPTPTSTTSQPKSGKASVSSQSSVVEEYKARVRRQQEQQRQQEFNDAASNLSQPYSLKLHKGAYHPMDNSISSLSTLSSEEPTNKSRRKVVISTTLLVVVWVIFCLFSVHGTNLMSPNSSQNLTDNVDPTLKNRAKTLTESEVSSASIEWYSIVILCVLALITLLFGIFISRQPKNQSPLNFKTPLVPWLPLSSILVNIYLMITLSDTTWIRFTIWLVLGFVIYFSYGMWHSVERRSEDQEVILYDISEQDGGR